MLVIALKFSLPSPWHLSPHWHSPRPIPETPPMAFDL